MLLSWPLLEGLALWAQPPWRAVVAVPLGCCSRICSDVAVERCLSAGVSSQSRSP